MGDETPVLGTAAWLEETLGLLTASERRSLMLPLARAHARNAVGRVRMAVHLHPGRHAHVPDDRLPAPDTSLTRAARETAVEILPSTLLNHSYRTYRFSRALGELEGLQVDAELLYAAAMLHDVGLVNPPTDSDFTLASSRIARGIAEDVGLSSAGTEAIQTAIAMHLSPGVNLKFGPVAYLLAAGAAIDLVGLRAGDLPTGALDRAVRDYPRLQFKDFFVESFRREAARVPRGRTRFLTRYAFITAIRLAPFDE